MNVAQGAVRIMCFRAVCLLKRSGSLNPQWGFRAIPKLGELSWWSGSPGADKKISHM